MRRTKCFSHPRWRMAVLFLLLIWGGAACTVDSAPSVLKIGLVAPFEGRYRYIGYDAIYAARLAVREINAAGGISGHKLVLVACDDRNDPTLARVAARNLSVDPDVVAVMGHYRQTTTVAAQPRYVEAGVPLLALGAWLTNTHGSTNQLAPSSARLADAMVAALSPDETDACGVVWGEDALALSLSRRLEARLCTSRDLDPTFALSSEPPHVAGEHLEEQRAAGWGGVLVGGLDLGSSEFVETAGEDLAEGQRFLTPYPFPQDLPETEAWRQGYTRMGPHVSDPQIYALPTYEAIHLLAEALRADVAARGTPSRAGVAAALRKVSRQGNLDTISLDAQGVWHDAPLYRYVWREGVPRLEQVLLP